MCALEYRLYILALARSQLLKLLTSKLPDMCLFAPWKSWKYSPCIICKKNNFVKFSLTYSICLWNLFIENNINIVISSEWCTEGSNISLIKYFPSNKSTYFDEYFISANNISGLFPEWRLTVSTKLIPKLLCDHSILLCSKTEMKHARNNRKTEWCHYFYTEEF